MDIKRVNHLIVKLLLLAAAVLLLWKLQFVFIILLVSVILTIILLPFVRLLHKAHIPAIFAVFVPLLVLIGLLTFLSVYVAPAVRDQSVQFAQNVPRYIGQLPFGGNIDIDAVRDWLNNQAQELDLQQIIVNVGTAIFKFIFALITILVITIYWLSDYPKIKRTLLSYLPSQHRTRAKDVWLRIENKLGKWFLGQIIVSTVVGVMTYIAALLLGLPYAAVLGVLAALLEIVPTVGPIAAALPAILLGASESVEKALLVTLVYIVIQQIESHFVTPVLMGRRVRVHPIAIITAFLIGSVMFGLVGALLSVPVAIMVSAAVDSFRNEAPQEPPIAERRKKKQGQHRG